MRRCLPSLAAYAPARACKFLVCRGGFTVNVYIVKIEGLSALVYVHKAHNVTQWKVHTLAEVPKERQEQALAKQQRIAHKRNCAVKTVEINRPPWTIDVLVATATTNPEN